MSPSQAWRVAAYSVLTAVAFIFFLNSLLKSIKKQGYRYQWKGWLLLVLAGALILLRLLFELPRSLIIFTLFVDFVFAVTRMLPGYSGQYSINTTKRGKGSWGRPGLTVLRGYRSDPSIRHGDMAERNLVDLPSAGCRME